MPWVIFECCDSNHCHCGKKEYGCMYRDRYKEEDTTNITLIVGLNEILRGEKQSSYSNELISKIRDNLVNEQGFKSKTTLSMLKAKEILNLI